MRNLQALTVRLVRRALRAKKADLVCTWLLILALVYVAAQVAIAMFTGRLNVTH
jgi:hypothetical protein